MMLLAKYFAVTLAMSLISIPGFPGSAFSYSNDNDVQSKTVHQSLPVSDEEKIYSDEFYKFEKKLLHEVIDFESIENSINTTFSGFEHDYLFSLLKIRDENYEDAYSLLTKFSSTNPGLFRYYDLLVETSKITGNLENLINEIDQQGHDENHFMQYLLGTARLSNGRYQKAIKIYNRLISEGIKAEDIFYNIAYAYRGIGDYNKGIENLTKAEGGADSSDFIFPKILNAKGSLYYLSGEYKLAEKNYKLANILAISIQNERERIRSVLNLSIIKDTYGDVYSARDDMINVLPDAEKIQDHKLIALLHSELGVNYTYTNNIIQARNNYEKSYKKYSLLKNSGRLSYLSSNIASIFLQQNNYRSALKYYKQGLEFAGENVLGQILNQTGIADVYSNMSNYSKAIEHYKQAEQLADSIKSISSLIKIDQGFGALFYNINKPNTALHFLNRSENRINIEEHPFEAAEIFHKTGTILSSIDSLQQAIDYLSRGLAIAQNSGDIYYEILVQTELGYTNYKSGKYSKAIELLTGALNISEQYELTQLMGLQNLYLGKVYYGNGDYQSSISAFNKSVKLGADASDINTQIESYYLLAQIAEKLGNNDEAENWYLKAISAIEKISAPLGSNQDIQIAHFTGFNELYNSLIQLYLSQKKYVEAFETLEKSRSRNTFLNLSNLQVSSSFDDEESLNRYMDLKWMIASGLYESDVVDSLSLEYNKLRDELAVKNPTFDSYNNQWKSLKNIQSGLSTDETVLSIYIAEDYLQYFLVRTDNFSSKKVVVGRDSIISMVSDIAPLYKSDLSSEEIYINQDLFSFNAEASWNLYDKVFKLLIENVPDGSTVIFSFPAELLLLPVEFLVTDWGKDDSPYYYEDKNFFIEKYTMMYSPSASIFVTQKSKAQSRGNNNLLLGDPFIASDDFTMSYRGALLDDDNFSTRNIRLFPLEYSRQEINNVDDIIAGSTVLLSEDATEENFKMNAPDSRIIHLSTHSFLYKNQPLIVVSKAENSEDDGYLEVNEILDLDLNCDLVVLSSCRSGIGTIDEAEGILGMQKAFFDAGAGSIVVSLWDVNDKYTSYFMKEFYKLLRTGVTKPEALRQAKIKFIKNYSANPYYWSSFILAGNPSKLEIASSSGTNLLYYLLIPVILLGSISILFYRKKYRR